VFNASKEIEAMKHLTLYGFIAFVAKLWQQVMSRDRVCKVILITEGQARSSML
jgi:hypothetical protein